MLRQALLAFGRQSGCSIVFDPNLGGDLLSQPLVGTMPPLQALRRLLGALPLQFDRVDAGIITVTGSAPPAAVARPTGPVIRRTATRPAPQPKRIEEVTVSADAPTGSRIRAADFGGFAQTDIITRVDVQRSGHQSLSDVLRFVPAVAGNSTSTLVTNGGDGTATVTLRGLPSENTLVLIDGHRTNPDALKAKSVDLNSLPLAMVERIEVLKDGASSAYGSDAIAGVVNIVTRREISGFELDIYNGVAQRGDLPTHQVSAAGGWRGDAVSFSWGASSYSQGELKSRDRAASRSADNRTRGGIDQRSSATVLPRVIVGDDALIRLGPNETPMGGTLPLRLASDDDRYDPREVTSAVVPSDRWSVFARTTLDLGIGQLRGGVLRNHTHADNTFASVPIFTDFQRDPLIVAADQAFNPFGVALTDVRRRGVEFGARHGVNSSDTWRGDLGLDISAAAIDAALQLSYHRTNGLSEGTHEVDATRLRRALGSPSGCSAPCVPVNLFGGAGSITPAMVNYLAATQRARGTSSLLNVTGDASTDIAMLPAGSLRAGIGFDLRHEEIHTDPDALTRSGDAIGGFGFGPTRGSRDVAEAYLETLVPLLRDSPGVVSLDLSLATRVSHYSDFGTTANPKLAVRYRPSTNWLVRAARSSGFRAPTLQQLFIADERSFQFLNDPCAIPANVFILVGCGRQSDPTLTQFLTTTGGNRHLRPERSTTTTFGVVWTPEAAPGLTFSVDYYLIEQRKVVNENAQYIVNQNARFGRFTDRVTRDERGNIKTVSARALNIGQRDVSGLDIAAKWQLPNSTLGNWEIAANGAYIHRFADRLTPDSPRIDHAGTFSDEASSGDGSLPHWKADAGVLWLSGNFEVRYDLFFVSKLTETVPRLDVRRVIEAWYSHNLQVSYASSLPLNARITAGVNNLLDTSPPFSAAAFNDSFDGRTYDLAGRFWYLRLSGEIE